MDDDLTIPAFLLRRPPSAESKSDVSERYAPQPSGHPQIARPSADNIAPPITRSGPESVHAKATEMSEEKRSPAGQDGEDPDIPPFLDRRLGSNGKGNCNQPNPGQHQAPNADASMEAWALHYASRGLSVVPLHSVCYPRHEIGHRVPR
jgi:hypothetical protein